MTLGNIPFIAEVLWQQRQIGVKKYEVLFGHKNFTNLNLLLPVLVGELTPKTGTIDRWQRA